LRNPSNESGESLIEEETHVPERTCVLTRRKGTRDELIRLIGGFDTIRIGGSGDLVGAADELRQIPGVERVDAERRSATLTVKDAPALVAEVVGTAASNGVTLSDVEISRPDLESVFLHLTGKGLRD